MSDEENGYFLTYLADQPGLAYLRDGTSAEWKKIGESCDGIPLAVQWSVARSNSLAEALAVAEQLTGSGQRGEELLEFSFRRVFDRMTPEEREVLQVLSMFQGAVSAEMLVVGTQKSELAVLDAAKSLSDDSLIHQIFEPEKNDWSYSLLPIARAFVRSDMAGSPKVEQRIRRELADYFEAKDVVDDEERLIVREIRQGKTSSEHALVDLAEAASRRGDLEGAQSLYERAMQRNPNSWRAAKSFAEFLRHKRNNITAALEMYNIAARSAPAKGGDRALIFREQGILLRDSGLPDATERAIRSLAIAHQELPNDAVSRHALAHMYQRKGNYRQVIELLGPIADHQNLVTRQKVIPLLHKAYDLCGEMLKAAELKQRYPDLI